MESPGGRAEGDGQRHRPGRRRRHQLQRVRLVDDQVRGEGRPDLDDYPWQRVLCLRDRGGDQGGFPSVRQGGERLHIHSRQYS